MQALKKIARSAALVVVMAGAMAKPWAAEPMSAAGLDTKETNARQLAALVSGSKHVGTAVALEGEVLWESAARDELVLQAEPGAFRVKMNLSGQPALALGQRVKLTGFGVAGRGFIREALVDNDGLHSVQEESGTVYLTTGLHELRADYFNSRAEYSFNVDYAGTNLARQPVPDQVLFHREPAGAESSARLAPGLNYLCYQGDWECLPDWKSLLPVKSGTVANFDLRVKTREQSVGLEYIGLIQIDQAGEYTFWLRSDDGSRLYLGPNRLGLEILGKSHLPAARAVEPGQALIRDEDCFWGTVVGTVTAIHVDPVGTMDLELSAGTNCIHLESDAANFRSPKLFSRIRATGLCRSVPVAGVGRVAGRLLFSEADQIEELAGPSVPSQAAVTTLAMLRQLAAGGQRTGGSFCLTGMVMAASSASGLFAFQDATGGVLVQMTGFLAAVAPGDQVVLTGNGVWDGNRLSFGYVPLVDNNRAHLRQEKAATIFLSAGKHPLHVSWFNRQIPGVLELYYQGPNLARQKIPNAALVRPEIGAGEGAVKWVQGLNYTCFEGDWLSVPKISWSALAAAGRATNFDVGVASRAEKVALEFDGFLDIAREGQYFFTLVSDDGSLFFIDELKPLIERLGTNQLAGPLFIAPRQILAPNQDNRWAEVEGTINFASERAGSLFLELSSVYGPMRVEVADGGGCSPLLLLGSRVKIRGFCQSTLVSGGPGIAAGLVVLGMDQIQLLESATAQWNRYPLESIQAAARRATTETNEVIVHVRGEAGGIGPGRILVRDATGTIEAEMAQPAVTNLAGAVEVLGRLFRSETNAVLRCSIYRRLPELPEANAQQLPVLTTVRQVKQLSREQAQRKYPVKIRGVITLVRGNGTGFIIQDDTSAIDTWWPSASTAALGRVGEYWEVEGETFVEFSPNIRIHRATRLGLGAMPEPVHPAWDQLLNGSLDTQYVELQGIVTAVETEGVTLLTRAGKLRVLLSPASAGPWSRYLNALVRIRGCVVPVRDQLSQHVLVGQLRLSNVLLNIDEPAPADPFTAELKRVSELLLFDARAGSLQRVKIVGQVLHSQGTEIFLADGTNAVRILPQSPVNLPPGELVEVVGFPELGGAAPVLREAVLRRTGSAPLPAPGRLAEDVLFGKGHEGALVSVSAQLIGLSGSRSQKILEMQAGSREFVARVADRDDALNDLIPGSVLELTGVYSQPGGTLASGQSFASFELLLNSPLDVKILERPPWWTPQKVLLFVAGMVVVILAAVFWIVLLRRQVGERSAQLAVEVQHREQVQQQNVLERERTRIAKDMHDQLGTNVTQVGLLAELAKKNSGDAGKTAAHAEKISQTAFELGRTLDEIVWAVNPKNDSLDKFCDYVAVQAQELFQLTNTLCRVDLPPEMPGYPLSAEVRHNLFLATKEALNNVARHAQAGEVWIRFKLEPGRFQISILDDGKGFVPGQTPALRNGLQNMKKRLEDAGGHFAVTSSPNRGTEVILAINVNQTPPAAAPGC